MGMANSDASIAILLWAGTKQDSNRKTNYHIAASRRLKKKDKNISKKLPKRKKRDRK